MNTCQFHNCEVDETGNCPECEFEFDVDAAWDEMVAQGEREQAEMLDDFDSYAELLADEREQALYADELSL